MENLPRSKRPRSDIRGLLPAFIVSITTTSCRCGRSVPAKMATWRAHSQVSSTTTRRHKKSSSNSGMYDTVKSSPASINSPLWCILHLRCFLKNLKYNTPRIPVKVKYEGWDVFFFVLTFLSNYTCRFYNFFPISGGSKNKCHFTDLDSFFPDSCSPRLCTSESLVRLLFQLCDSKSRLTKMSVLFLIVW